MSGDLGLILEGNEINFIIHGMMNCSQEEAIG